MEVSENKKKSPAALITYALAVVFLLLGLCLPLFAGKGILAAQLPQIFNSAANDRIFDFGKTYDSGYPMQLFGKGKTFDVTAWILVAYTIVTLVALICLIPAGISYKKANGEGAYRRGKACVRIAYVLETAALIVISLYFIVNLQLYPVVKISYSLLAAMGGVALMLIILSCINKGRTGGVKFALALLSAFALLMLFNLAQLFPAKAVNGWLKIAGKLKCAPFLYGSAEGSVTGIDYVAVLFETNTFGSVIKAAGAVKYKALIVLTLIAALLVLINYFIDLISLSSNAKAKGLLFNCLRYGLEVLAIVCLFITAAVCKFKPGFALSLIIIAAGIQLIISIARLVPVLIKKRADKPVKEKEIIETAPQTNNNYVGENAYAAVYAENYNASPYPYAKAAYGAPDKPITDEDYKPVHEYKPEPPKPAPEPEYRTVQDYFRPVREQSPAPAPVPEPPKPAPEPVPEPVREEAQVPVHNVYNTYMPNVPVQESAPEPVDRIYKMNTVYQGPTDDFMRKLSNSEKIEFSMIFIEKSKGDTGKVPDYIIGGDNRKFFSSVFIYLGKLRSLVSDGLLNKMYKELNML